MRYLVTGGAGFIGAALVRRLLAAGQDVTVLAHRGSARLAWAGPFPGRIVHGDIRDAEAVHSAAVDCDAVAHLAYPQGRGGEPRDTMDVAVRGTYNVLSACERYDVPELLLVSSPDACGDAHSPIPELTRLTVPDETNPYWAYGGGKIASEMMAMAWLQSEALQRLVIARPFNIYGPDMGNVHLIPQVIRQIQAYDGDDPVMALPMAGGGMASRSFCYISDCIDQLITILDAGGSGIYNVGSEEEALTGAVAMSIARHLGRSALITDGPPHDGPFRRVPDMTKTLTLCGYKPRVSLDEGLERTVSWYKNNG